MPSKCKVCGATEKSAEFYKGVNTRCKECHKEAVRINRRENVDRYRAYDAKRFKEDPRVIARHKRYQKTDAGKASLQASRQKWVDDNSEKRAAHVILGNRVRDSKVIKPDHCSRCGKSGCRIDGHHHDYARPLDVVWLCRQCHVNEHKGDTQ